MKKKNTGICWSIAVSAAMLVSITVVTPSVASAQVVAPKNVPSAPASINPAVAPATPGYVAVTPARIMDTQSAGTTVDGVAAKGGALGKGISRDLKVLGRASVPASGVSAVTVNIHALTPTRGVSGYLTAWAAGSTRPNVISADGWNTTTVTVQVGANGSISIFNGGNSTHVIVDITGWYLKDADYTPISPARIVNTAAGYWPNPFGSTETRDYQVTGRDGIPATGVQSVVLTLSLMPTTSYGEAKVWPKDGAIPSVSAVMNFDTPLATGSIITKVGTGGKITVSAASSNIALDVVGWFASTSVYTPITPSRYFEASINPTNTFDGQSRVKDILGKGATTTFQVAGRGQVPAAGVRAVMLSIAVWLPSQAIPGRTVVGGPANIAMWPSGATATTQPLVTAQRSYYGSINVIAQVGLGGKISFKSLTSTPYMSIDVVGWFSNAKVVAPSIPGTAATTVAHRAIQAQWSPSEENGGSPITVYTATAQPSGKTCTAIASATSCWIGDVDYGIEQTITVRAGSKIGLTSGASQSRTATAFAVTSVDIGDNAACGVVSNGRAACWGPGSSVYGRGPSNSPHRRTTGFDWIYTADYTPLEGVSKLSVSNHHGCAVTNAGRVYCWGTNVMGEIGIPALRDGSLVNAPYAVEVSPAITDATDIFTMTDYYNNGISCAIRTGGKVSCWGSNRFGTLGIGTSSTNRAISATEISGLTGVTQLSSDGMTVCARLSTGAVKCWGADIGTNLYQSQFKYSPTSTTFTSGVDTIVVGYEHLCVSKSGVIDCLGLQTMNKGSTNFKPSPRRVTGPPSVRSFAQAASDTDCVVTDSNQLWCWGENGDRILRDGSSMDNEDPTQITTALPVSRAAVSGGEICAVPTRGGYECWGVWSETLS